MKNLVQNDKQFIVRKSFDFGWDRTRVPTIGSLQRWPLGHPARFFFEIKKNKYTQSN